MAETGRTIVALKSSFLRTQIRILSQPLAAEQKPRSERGGVTDASVKEAQREVNRMVRRHNQCVFSDVAIRHVAEQIDQLYWDTSAPPDAFDDESEPTLEGDDAALRVGDDLARAESIAKLPTAADEIGRVGAKRDSAADVETYEATVRRLKGLDEKRTALRAKIDAYQRLGVVLAPFRDPLESTQPNLVTRDGKLADEIARSRELGVRVAARLPALKEKAVQSRGLDDHASWSFPDDVQRLKRAWDAT